MRNSPRSPSAMRACSRIEPAASATKLEVWITSGFTGLDLSHRSHASHLSQRAMRRYHSYDLCDAVLDRAMGAAMLGQVLLVIFLGAIEGRRRLDLGHDRAAKPAA